MAFNDTYRFGAHAIIFNTGGHVLLLKKTYGDKGWSLPGGGVDPGETIHQALLRECREELGIEVQDVVLTGFYYHSRLNAQVRAKYYFGALWNGTTKYSTLSSQTMAEVDRRHSRQNNERQSLIWRRSHRTPLGIHLQTGRFLN